MAMWALCVLLVFSGLSSTAAARVLTAGGVTREYFIAVEVQKWAYANESFNYCYGRNYSMDEFEIINAGLGSTLFKSIYVEYTSATFKTRKVRPASEEHLGILGPLVGDKVVVHLLNRAHFPSNFVPQGLLGTAPNQAQVVAPGQNATYTYTVPEEAGPGALEGVSSKLWLYRSLLNQAADNNAGLIGPIIVTAAGKALPDGKPTDVDTEFVTVFEVFDESASQLFAQNNATFGPGPTFGLPPLLLSETVYKASINGLMFCKLKGLTAEVGSRVRWHVAGQGDTLNMHGIHWHGNVVDDQGRHADSLRALSSTTRSVNLIADNPGTWLFHCHVDAHKGAGMIATYTITGKKPTYDRTGVARQYYIAAEEHLWNYAPDSGDSCSGTTEPFSAAELPFVQSTNATFGSTYLKALYVEYTDGTFTKKKKRSAAEEHLGMLGPLLRAEVGDTVHVHLLNRLSVPVSIHAHGLRYAKNAEGAPYADGTSGANKLDDAIAPGVQYTYFYEVPARAGPGPADPSSVLWMYHGHSAETADTYAGLVGGFVISRRGAARSNGMPKDVDREFVLFMMVTDETSSVLYPDNLRRFLPNLVTNTTVLIPPSPNEETGGDGALTVALDPAVEAAITDPAFVASNQKSSINGRLFCNLHGLDAEQGDRLRVYVMTLGSTVDEHAAQIISVTAVDDQQSTDAIHTAPGIMTTADSLLSVPGNWLLACQNGPLQDAGMKALVQVAPSKKAVNAALAPAGKHAKSSLVSALAFLPSALKGIYAGIGGHSQPVKRTYYVQAEEVMWDYAPRSSEGNLCGPTPQPFSQLEEYFVFPSGGVVGNVALKSIYVGYTDGSFKMKAPQPAEYGYLGPLIKAQVGDVIEIVFRNNVTRAVNLVLSGGLIPDAAAHLASPVQPGRTVAQTWTVPAVAGPAQRDLNTVAHLYGSTVAPWQDANAGLVGVLMVTAKGALRSDGQVDGADVVMPLLFHVADESNSPYFAQNLAADAAAAKAANITLPTIVLPLPTPPGIANLKNVINGHLYCSGPTVTFKRGDTVRWLLLDPVSQGQQGYHDPYFTNQIITKKGQSLDAAYLLPGYTSVVDMIAHHSGDWLYQCDVQEHAEGGMIAKMSVSAS